MRALVAGLVVAWLSSGCAGTLPRPVELSIAHSNGARLELGELRGHALLLFLFATYDEVSQFSFVPLSRLAENEPQLTVIGVALQPEAAEFLRLFQRSLKVPFELYYDPDNQLLGGDTAIGKVRAVPAFIAIDAEGRVRGEHYGPASAGKLYALAQLALEH